MCNYAEFKRRVPSPPNEKRKARKFSMTDSEYTSLLRVTTAWGFNKPRDLIVSITSHPSIEEAYTSNQLSLLKVQLGQLATQVNKIEAGVNVQSSTKKLIQEVKRLCQDYRF